MTPGGSKLTDTLAQGAVEALRCSHSGVGRWRGRTLMSPSLCFVEASSFGSEHVWLAVSKSVRRWLLGERCRSSSMVYAPLTM